MAIKSTCLSIIYLPDSKTVLKLKTLDSRFIVHRWCFTQSCDYPMNSYDSFCQKLGEISLLRASALYDWKPCWQDEHCEWPPLLCYSNTTYLNRVFCEFQTSGQLVDIKRLCKNRDTNIIVTCSSMTSHLNFPYKIQNPKAFNKNQRHLKSHFFSLPLKKPQIVTSTA